LSEFKGLSVTEARREHFRLLKEESRILHERAANEPILEEVDCPLECAAEPEFLFVKDGSSFVRCPDCGLIYVNPQMTETTLSEHFASSPAWEVWASTVLPSSEQQTFDREKYRSALENIQKLHPSGKKLLDIGASSGLFLSLAQESGYEISGIEPSEAACDVAKQLFGISLSNSNFADYSCEENCFDIVTFWASLEYHKHPKAALVKASTLLCPKGLLLIFVSGNAHSFAMRMLKEQNVGFLFNRLWYFSPASLDRLVTQVDPSLNLVERDSLVPSLDVIARYLSYEDPYNNSTQELFTEDELGILKDLIESKAMGYKFLSIYRLDG